MAALAMHKLQRLSGVMSDEDTPAAILEIYKDNLVNSPLLSLPAEIRLLIYEYVLSRLRLAFLQRRGNRVVTTAHRNKFWNPNIFQSLCKLTRIESRRLEMKHNLVTFVGDAAYHLMRANDWRLDDLTKVTTSVSFQDVQGLGLHADPKMLHDMVFKFARKHPDVNIDVYVPAWQFGGQDFSVSDFMCLGWTIEKAVRGKNRSFPGVKKAVKAWKGPGGNLNLTNLTFRPLVLFGELEFRRKIGHGPDHKFVQKTAFNVYKSEQEVIEAVRDWHENGI